MVNGQDLLGLVMTINGCVLPLHLLFCAKQGRANTHKPDLLITLVTQLKEAFAEEGIDLTAFALTMDSWLVSQELRPRLAALGFHQLVLAGKGNYPFTLRHQTHPAATWKKHLPLRSGQWGIDVPALRVPAYRPTFGRVVLFFFQKRTPRSYYRIDFSTPSLRGAEIWHLWKAHQAIEQFWKILKSLLHLKDMQLPGKGLYTALLIKVLAYVLALRCKAHKTFSKSTLTQRRRKISREEDLRALLAEHFHWPILLT